MSLASEGMRESSRDSSKSSFPAASTHSLQLPPAQTVKLTADTSKPPSHGNTCKSPAGLLNFRANETFPWRSVIISTSASGVHRALHTHTCTQSSACDTDRVRVFCHSAGGGFFPRFSSKRSSSLRDQPAPNRKLMSRLIQNNVRTSAK